MNVRFLTKWKIIFGKFKDILVPRKIGYSIYDIKLMRYLKVVKNDDIYSENMFYWHSYVTYLMFPMKWGANVTD